MRMNGCLGQVTAIGLRISTHHVKHCYYQASGVQRCLKSRHLGVVLEPDQEGVVSATRSEISTIQIAIGSRIGFETQHRTRKPDS